MSKLSSSSPYIETGDIGCCTISSIQGTIGQAGSTISFIDQGTTYTLSYGNAQKTFENTTCYFYTNNDMIPTQAWVKGNATVNNIVLDDWLGPSTINTLTDNSITLTTYQTITTYTFDRDYTYFAQWTDNQIIIS